ncbi:MAG: HDOD domain-containing protein [Gammaproteobacteria bacterium]|nr:HDOD domain-containing protein [Gammaproteobacteria bacterium]MDH5630559.1 HDOD domain-containing protein [Gammaproteobacteria bacterium]
MSIEKEFLHQLTEAITQDKLVLPTLPEIALKIRDVVSDSDVTAEAVANVISQDAALSAKIMKVANSPLVRGTVSITSLQLAVTRMGMAFVKNLATGLAMEQMFQATNDLVDKKLRQSWEHSTDVAAICHVLASNFTKLQPDQAALAGLVHEIGVLPILTLAEEHPAILQHEDSLDKVIQRIQGKLGRMILKTWDFPPELIDVPIGCCDFKRNSGDSADYIDVVTVAKIQSYSDDHNPFTDLNTSEIPAFQKLGFADEIDVQNIEQIAVDADDVKSAMF